MPSCGRDTCNSCFCQHFALVQHAVLWRKHLQLLLPSVRPCPACPLVVETSKNYCFCQHFALVRDAVRWPRHQQLLILPAFAFVQHAGMWPRHHTRRPCRARSPVAETPATAASASSSPLSSTQSRGRCTSNCCFCKHFASQHAVLWRKRQQLFLLSAFRISQHAVLWPMHQQLLLLQTFRFPARSLVAETPATVAFASEHVAFPSTQSYAETQATAACASIAPLSSTESCGRYTAASANMVPLVQHAVLWRKRQQLLLLSAFRIYQHAVLWPTPSATSASISPLSST